jgi:hypothetical protein
MHHVLSADSDDEWARRDLVSRPLLILTVAVAALPGCTRHRAASPSPPGTSVASGPRSVRTSPTVMAMVRQKLVLTADLSESPAAWQLVTTIPFGRSERALGLLTDSRRTPVPYLPRSFSVGPDGSIWILDVLKHRVAHYSVSGAFLGAIGGFRFDRFSPHPRDVVFSDGQLFVLEEDHLKGILVTVSGDGTLHRARAHVGQAEVGVGLLYPSNPGVAGLLFDRTADGSGEPRDVARFDPTSGEGVLLPGVPVGDDRRIDLRMRGDDQMEILFTMSGRAALQPIDLRAVTGSGQRARGVEIVTGPTIMAVTEGAAAIVVRISPSRPGDAERYGGGVWLLRVGVGGKPLLWERLPAPGISDEEQVRRIAAGPDGRLYLMVPTKEGELIYRM